MTQDVFRRRVFYIPGFDPFPPAVTANYTEPSPKSRRAYPITQSHKNRCAGTDNFGWRVISTIEGRDTVSDITVLTWSDLVKSSMDRGVVVDLSVAVQNCVDLYCLGCAARRDEVAQGSRDCGALPRIAQLGFAILCAAVLSSVLWSVHPVFGIVSWGIIWPILALFQKYDGKIFAHYLMQDYAHTAHYDPDHPFGRLWTQHRRGIG